MKFSREEIWSSMARTVKSLNKRQAFNISIFFISLSIFLTGCGLEEYAYLYPPDAWNDSGTAYYFKNSTKNDSTVFFGYHILYKFYASTDAITTAISSVESLYDSYPTSIYSKMKSSSLGYKDLVIGTSSTGLTIGQSYRDVNFTILMDFLSVTKSSGDDVPITMYSYDGGTEPTTSPSLQNFVYRSVKDGNSYKGFSQEDLVSGNDDLIAGTNYDSNTGKTYLMLYILAYGYDTTTWNAVYSEPQYFNGYVTLTVYGY
jgi:hypothetical protein